ISAPPASRCCIWVACARTPTATAWPTTRTPVRARPPASSSTSGAAHWTPIRTACPTGSTSARAPPRERTSTRRAAPPTRTATVDASGCPLDSDLDGVPDGIDQCPNTPAGTRVDATGCPLPVEAVRTPTPAPQAAAPAKCPPAPPGSQVDANGCLVLFAPEPARPATPGAPAPRPTLVLRGVNFETGRSVLTRDSYLVLDAVAASL